MKTLSEMIAVMQGAADGKKVESSRYPAGIDGPIWRHSPEPSWDWVNYDYRIAPEPPKPKTVPMAFDDRRKLIGRVLVKHRSVAPKRAVLLTSAESDTWEGFEYQPIDQPDGPWLPFTKTISP